MSVHLFRFKNENIQMSKNELNLVNYIEMYVYKLRLSKK